jgi:hypothetical protein
MQTEGAELKAAVLCDGEERQPVTAVSSVVVTAMTEEKVTMAHQKFSVA